MRESDIIGEVDDVTIGFENTAFSHSAWRVSNKQSATTAPIPVQCGDTMPLDRPKLPLTFCDHAEIEVLLE
jgi:hypothetical protein